MDKKLYVGFDIDETIIHSKEIFLDNKPYCDCDFNIKNKEGEYDYSVYIRPNASLLLNYIDENYNLFFYTRATKDYALHILKEFGLESKPLFHSKHIENETVDTLYEGFKRFKVKRLDKIAKLLNCEIDDILFFDDIRNNNEIRPIYQVVKVPEYIGYDNDNALSVIYKKFKECENKNNSEIIENIKNTFNESVKIKNKFKY